MPITKLNNELLSDAARIKIKGWDNLKEEVNRISWHEYFILQAYLVSTRSLDAQTQCGCVLVDKDMHVVSSGYNSFVRNVDDDILPNLRPDKYDFMMHSEHNAILSCARAGIKCDGLAAYITGPPCCNCLQYMYQSGIKNIYYPQANLAKMTDNDKYKTDFEILLFLMKNLNVYVVDLDETMLNKIEKIKSLR